LPGTRPGERPAPCQTLAHVLITLFVLCLVAAPASEAEAPKDRRAVVDSKRVERLQRSFFQRTLSSHPFVQPRFVASAIPTSHLGLGFGGAGVSVEGSDPSTGAARRSTYLAGLATLDGGIRIGKWVGFGAQFDGIAGVGGTPKAALDVGAAAGFRWGVHGLVRVLHRPSTALSVGASVAGGDGRGLLLQPGFEYLVDHVNQLIEDGPSIEDIIVDRAELQDVAARSVRRVQAIGGGARVGLAQAFGRFVGLQVGLDGGGRTRRLRYDDGQARNVRSSMGYLRAGAALGFDAGLIPLAVLLEYDADMEFGADANGDTFRVAHRTDVGLFLNGLTHTIGVLAIGEFAEGQTNLGGLLSFRSYF
jgi:hypothetical protein